MQSTGSGFNTRSSAEPVPHKQCSAYRMEFLVYVRLVCLSQADDAQLLRHGVVEQVFGLEVTVDDTQAVQVA